MSVYANDMHHWDWTNEDTDTQKLLSILGLIDMRIAEIARLEESGDDRLGALSWYTENEKRWLMHRIHTLDPTIGSLALS